MTFTDRMSQRMLSYAQNGEDMVLWRAFRDQPEGFYVDVGAHDPVGGSLTKIFSDRGWRGINIEPIPRMCELMQSARPNDVNLNLGIADQTGHMTFWEVRDDPERSTFNTELAEYYLREGYQVHRQDVPVERLDKVLEQHVPAGRHIDFLKIDAEGFEEQVLRSIDLRRWRPSVVLAEHNFFERWESILTDAAYRLTLYDGLNRFYVHESRPDLIAPLSLPPLRSMDNYELWLHVHQLEAARARIAELEAQLGAQRVAPSRLDRLWKEVSAVLSRASRGLRANR